MKNFIKITVVAFVSVIVFAACAEKFGAKDALMGWIWSQQGRPEVINMDGDPVGQPETQPQLIAPDTIMLQGNAGAEMDGDWQKCDISAMGENVEFSFRYDGSKHSTIAAQVSLKLRFDGRDVYALDKHCLKGTLREVSREDAPFLQTNVAPLVLKNEAGDVVASKDVVIMIGAALRDTVIIHDTTTVIVHDTTVVTIHDTTYITVHDSVTVHDTTTVTDSITVIYHDSVITNTVRERRQWCLGWDNTPVYEAGEWRLYATDSLVEKTTVNGNVSYERKSFRHYDVYQIPDFSGNFDGSQEGNCFYFNANGTVQAGGQTVTCRWMSSHIVGQVFLHNTNVTSTLDKHRSAASRVCFNNGVATYWFRDMQNNDVASLTRNYTNSEQRNLTYIDTAWNCGQVTAANYSNGTITYAITRQGSITRHYSAAPFTEDGGTINQNTTYTYSLTTTGSVANVAVGQNQPVNGNTANFTGFSATMTQVGNQNFCTHTHTSVTRTSTGITIYGTYNGQTTTVNVTINVPTPGQWPSDAIAWGSDSYFTDIVDNISEDRQTNAVVIVPSTLKFYAHEWQSDITRNTCDSVTLTSDEYTFIMSKVNSSTENWVPCKVYDHNNPTVWYPGVVRSQQLSNGSWKLTYMMANGTLAYYMSQSSWTVAGYNGRDANRGVMDANGALSFDGITLQVK